MRLWGRNWEKVRGYVELGLAEGAELVVDGRGLKVPGHVEEVLKAVKALKKAA